MTDAKQVLDGVATGAHVAEALVPGVAPFTPAIEFIITAIRAHFNATGMMPTEAQVLAAVPERVRAIEGMWDGWTPARDGTLAGG